MSAYIIADITILDTDGLEQYGNLSYPTLVAAGGKILASTNQAEILEGNWQPGLVVIIEFATAEKARQWLNSPEYQPARQVRFRSAKTNIILLDADG